jgi:uncharacterized protein (DUF3820 family)
MLFLQGVGTHLVDLSYRDITPLSAYMMEFQKNGFPKGFLLHLPILGNKLNLSLLRKTVKPFFGFLLTCSENPLSHGLVGLVAIFIWLLLHAQLTL